MDLLIRTNRKQRDAQTYQDQLDSRSTIDSSSCPSSTSIPATLGHGPRKWLSEHESRNTLKFTANLAFHLYSRQPRTQPRALIRKLPLAPSLSFNSPLFLLFSPTQQSSTYPALPPRHSPVLFYSRGTSAFASATPFNLAPGPPSLSPQPLQPLSATLCPSISSVCLTSDRFARTRLFLFLFVVVAPRVFASYETPVFAGVGGASREFQSLVLVLVTAAAFISLSIFISPLSSRLGYDRFTHASSFPPSPRPAIRYTEYVDW